jgi:hypothetical protein
MACSQGPRIRDYFWGDEYSFDAKDTEPRDDRPDIFYLHGGLHICTDVNTGVTLKRKSDVTNLLDLDDSAPYTRPLFISEGQSADKMKSIRRSDYLSFCYDKLIYDDNALVTFGHSLSNSDSHIVDAIRSRMREMAVALLSSDGAEIIAEKTGINKAMQSRRVRYFNAATHPLGSSNLKIRP